MTKKPESFFDSELMGNIRGSAREIWLAGLGAFAKAQEEGSKVFDTLVKEGAKLNKKTQDAASEAFAEMPGKFSDVSAKAGAQWKNFEAGFDDRFAKALKRLGVPTAKEVEALSERVEALSAKLDKLTRRSTATRGAAAVKKKSLKPASKR